MTRNATKKSKPVRIPVDVLVRGGRCVQKYLKKYRALAKLIPPICRRIREEFGREAELTLEIHQDPEFDDRHPILYVRLPRYDSATMDRIYRITAAFDDELTNASGWFLVTTDFRKPLKYNAV
ncbi:MAG: hypothetical protein L0Y72_12830 [Gemmataceae bacterium]|nr:hypothetical protein [Gemmataceae bacterium]MCI0739924.1 hypothetical protein [Gemmataceae bacterium]